MEKQGMLELKFELDENLKCISIEQNGQHLERVNDVEILTSNKNLSILSIYQNIIVISVNNLSYKFLFSSSEIAATQHQLIRDSVRSAAGGNWMIYEYPFPEAKAAKENSQDDVMKKITKVFSEHEEKMKKMFDDAHKRLDEKHPKPDDLYNNVKELSKKLLSTNCPDEQQRILREESEKKRNV